MVRHEVDQLAVEAEEAAQYRASHSPAPLRRSPRRPAAVGRRARDHAQDLGGRRLLLERSRSSRLRASSSVNRRTFSMAITAWSAKVSRSAICRSVNGRLPARRMRSTPIASPSRTSGTERWCRMPPRCVEHSPSDTRPSRAARSWTMRRPAIARPARRRPSRRDSDTLDRRNRSRSAHECAARRCEHVVHAEDRPRRKRRTAGPRSPRPRRAPAGRRSASADHPQDLAGRGLLLQRLGELGVRCSAARSNRRAFSMAITAWSAKSRERDLLSVNGRTSSAT